MTQEEVYAQLLAKSAKESTEARNRKERGMAYKTPTVFTAIRKNNDHDENVVIDTFAEMAGHTREEFLAYNNTMTIASARHIMIFTLRERLSMSLQQVGKIVGRDHSTVASSVLRAKEIIRQNPFLVEVIDNVVERSKREKQ